MTARFIRIGFFSALLTLFVAQPGVAQDASGPPSAEAPSEGLSVHGHWTVTVVRDGEVVERREFENGLQASGQVGLGLLITGERAAGDWTILLQSDAASALCDANTAEPLLGSQCTISESAAELTHSMGSDDPFEVTLSGSETAIVDGNITLVHTFLYLCSSTSSPDSCVEDLTGTQDWHQFTTSTLASPLAVQAGDVMNVTVVITFGTATT